MSHQSQPVYKKQYHTRKNREKKRKDGIINEKPEMFKPMPFNNPVMYQLYIKCQSKLHLESILNNYGIKDILQLETDLFFVNFDNKSLMDSLTIAYPTGTVYYDGNEVNALLLNPIQHTQQRYQEFSPHKNTPVSEDRTTIGWSDTHDYSPSVHHYQTPVISPYSDMDEEVVYNWPSRQEYRGTKPSTVVVVEDCKSLTDLRTTLMVRNIPNRLSQSILLNYIDEKFLGGYDFFYMPIDKSSSANMGYAFINMTHAKYVAEFHKAFNQYKWPHQCSTKICEVYFARIQGYNCLCETFQKPTKNLSDKLPKPNIYAKYYNNIYYKELPITPESEWKFYKKICNVELASDLPIAKQLYESKKNEMYNNIWPEIYEIIKSKMQANSNYAPHSYEDINSEYFKELCKKVYFNTEMEFYDQPDQPKEPILEKQPNSNPLDLIKPLYENWNHENINILQNLRKPPGYE